MKTANTYRLYLLFILLLVAFFKLLFTATTSLSLFSEETQYWLWSKNLDWNYYSKPLMVAVYNYLSTSLLGDIAVAVRLNAVFFSSITVWLVFEMSLYMFGQVRSALLAACMLLVMPFFHLASFFHTTDSSLICYWLLSLFLIWKAVSEEKMAWWVFAGLATAMGMLSKSVMILILPITFLYILLTNPKKLLRPDFYIYCMVAGLSLVPLVIWNFQNDFVTFRHVGTLGGVEGGSGSQWELSDSIKYLSEYIGGQMAVISAFFIPFAIMAFYRLVKYREQKLLFLLLPVICVSLLFSGIAVFKRVEVNWPAFVHVSLPVAMVYALGFVGKKWEKYSYYATAVSGILLVLIMKPAPLDAIGFKNVLRPDKDPLARMAGFRELGGRVDFLIDSLDLDKKFIFSDNYHISSEMAFYVKGNPQTYTINLGRRKNQFDLWPGIKQFENKGYYGIFIVFGEDEREAVNSGFAAKMHDETVTAEYRGKVVNTFRIQVFDNLIHIKEEETSQY